MATYYNKVLHNWKEAVSIKGCMPDNGWGAGCYERTLSSLKPVYSSPMASNLSLWHCLCPVYSCTACTHHTLHQVAHLTLCTALPVLQYSSMCWSHHTFDLHFPVREVRFLFRVSSQVSLPPSVFHLKFYPSYIFLI